MNIVLWVLASVLAVAFLAAGSPKLIQPKEKLTTYMKWAEPLPVGAVKTLGALEVLAAAGLILPPATGIAPVLAPLAAVGLVIVMAGAIVIHAPKREWVNVGVNALLLILAVVVAWGRFGPYHFG
jgi:uncharacterized membrane protein YphA (DoxX/SURF4 family)